MPQAMPQGWVCLGVLPWRTLHLHITDVTCDLPYQLAKAYDLRPHVIGLVVDVGDLAWRHSTASLQK